MTPQPELLERLIRAQSDDSAMPTLADPAVTALVNRIRVAKRI